MKAMKTARRGRESHHQSTSARLPGQGFQTQGQSQAQKQGQAQNQSQTEGPGHEKS